LAVLFLPKAGKRGQGRFFEESVFSIMDLLEIRTLKLYEKSLISLPWGGNLLNKISRGINGAF
jgi:hypothetical protein